MSIFFFNVRFSYRGLSPHLQRAHAGRTPCAAANSGLWRSVTARGCGPTGSVTGCAARHEARHIPRLRLAPPCSQPRPRPGVAELAVVRRRYAHRMKEAIIAAALVAGVALWLIVRARAQEPRPTQPPSQDARRAASSDLRAQALKGTRAAFGLDAVASPTTPWGVVMETGFPEGSFTLVALSDGSASIYLSSGGGSIGGRAHETIRKASQAMVALAAKFQPKASA